MVFKIFCVLLIWTKDAVALEGLTQYFLSCFKDSTGTGKQSEAAEVSEFSCQYAGGESNIEMFGGNSNWRGPIWLCSKCAIKSSFFCAYQ